MIKKVVFYFIFVCTSCLSFANPPPAADVFQLTSSVVDPNTFTLTWHIKPGFFLYQKRIKMTEPASSNLHLGELRFPAPRQQTDRQGHLHLVYRENLTLPVAVLGREAGETLIQVHYQGCADDGFCYPPQTACIKLTIDNHLALQNTSLETNDVLPEPQNAPLNDHDKFERLFSTHNWIIIVFSFFGFGLLLSFTPCVLPMVPVLSGIILGHEGPLSTRKAFLLSLSYVLSMSFTYALVGALVALLGSNLQIIMQSPWAIGSFSLIFILLALSMFDFYQLRLPTSWQAKLATYTRSKHGGHYLGSAIMGCLSTLILSPCVTAPLIGVLGYIAQYGDVLTGCVSLFTLGLGMGTPLLLMGLSAGKWLPRAGQWMNVIKAFFGVMLLAVAIYLLARVLPDLPIMILWSSLLIFSGIYTGAFHQAQSPRDHFRKGLGMMLFVYGILILIGASQGNNNPLKPLESINEAHSQALQSPLNLVHTMEELDKAMAQAKGKPIMLDFYADWCASCKIMAATTLRDAQIQEALQRFVVLTVDVTNNNAETQRLLNHFNVVAPPTFLFFDAQGHELTALQLVGDVSVPMFYHTLNQVPFVYTSRLNQKN